MAQGMIVVVEGTISVRETKVGKKSGNPYSVCEVAWMGGSSGSLFLRDDELARVPGIGSVVRLVFEAKAGQDGVRPARLMDVQTAQTAQPAQPQQEPGSMPEARPRRAA